MTLCFLTLQCYCEKKEKKNLHQVCIRYIMFTEHCFWYLRTSAASSGKVPAYAFSEDL